MRIIYFYQYFTTPQGSWSTRAYEMSRRWARDGDHVTVVTSLYDKSDLKPTGFITKLNIEGVDVRLINIGLSNKHGPLKRIFSFAAYALVACWYALTLPADVVVASSGPITVSLPGLVARYLRRVPMVFEVRDLWPEGAIQLGLLKNRLMITAAQFMEIISYKASSSVIALSDGMAKGVSSVVSQANVCVIPNAADNELFGSKEISPLPDWTIGKKLVIYTGTIGRMDDCSQIVEMAATLQCAGREDVEVVIIGDGMERSALENIMYKQGLKHIHFLGLYPKKDVANWLKQADCALLVFRDVPCLDTVSPNKMFDAFAAGTPIVQTTQGWIKELFEKENCGITVPANNPELMAEAVVRIIDNPTEQKEMSDNCRRLARDVFDRDVLANKMRTALLVAAGKAST